TGIVINGVYDAWTPARAYQHYHAGIRILSETASARLASPTNVPFEQLRPQVNVNPKVRTWNFPEPWRGGEWRLRDIVAYQESGAFALLRNAARYRDRWLGDFYKIGREAVRERKEGELFAFLILEPEAGDSAREWKMNGLARLESILKRGAVEIIRSAAPFNAGGTNYPAGTRIVLMSQPYGAFAKALLERQRYPDLREYPGGPPRRPYDVTAHTLPLLMGVNVVEINRPFDIPRAAAARDQSAPPLPRLNGRAARIGLYKSYAASMDEGWTRWIFDQYKIEYTSVMDAEIRAGNLKAKYDCIVLPDQSAQQIFNGLSRQQYPAEIAGGLGREGVESLRRFIEAGGTLITLNEASDFAIEHLGVPVKNVLRGVSSREFYCPGSILKIELDLTHPMAAGAPALASGRDETIAWFETGPALETTGANARVIARYAGAGVLLLSGWLLGAEKIAGKGAIVEAKQGRGRVVMFAFRPQYRGQSVATFPLLINAMFLKETQ
ncbi:MAG TPA: hypothetical protein VNO14_09170, partial [Blastocatellia bacterium]|nr:hypothetical protein [Blastocatellia bacterium]